MNIEKKIRAVTLLLFVFGLIAWAETLAVEIESLFVREMPLRKFAELLTRGCGSDCKVMVSEKAASRPVSFYLSDTDIEETLKAVCNAYGLWYRKSIGSSIVQIMTQEEYKAGLNLYAEEEVVVVPILYPAPDEIGESVACLFQDRVVWDPPDDMGEDQIDHIEDALDRMDTMADRATLVDDRSSSSSSSSYSSHSSSSSSRFSSSRNSSRNSNSRSSTLNSDDVNSVFERQSRELEILKATGTVDAFETRNRPGMVYLSSSASANALILRSSDSESLQRVKTVIQQLDKPRAQVLLEVKVLQLDLSDDRTMGVDWLFEEGDFSGGRSTGITDDPGSLISTVAEGLVPDGTGINSSSAIFNYVTDSVRARIQMLEEEGNITSLATPSLMVVDNEASRVFIGKETTVLEKVELSTTYYGDDNENFYTSYEVTAPRERIGTTLLITPKIHADRTVTIRILQEETELGEETSIQFGETDSDMFTTQDIEERSVVSTVLAKDGNTVAIGGLIREKKTRSDSGVPVLMDIPLLGNLFKKSNKSVDRSELLIMIRPHVVLAPGEEMAVSREFIRRNSENQDLCDFVDGEAE